MTTWTLAIFAILTFSCVWFMGWTCLRTLRFLTDVIDKMRLQNLDRSPTVDELPDYIPMGNGEGGFYKQPDGTWIAQLNGAADMGQQSTVESVEGSLGTPDLLENDMVQITEEKDEFGR